MKKIKIFDTTLRDGEQSPGCSMNISEKIKFAKQLDELNVDVIEAGFAIASPGDFASVSKIAEVVEHATVASLARALKGDIDVAYEAVKNAKHPRIHLFIATSEIHMKYKLHMSEDEIIAHTKEMVSYAKSLCDDIEFSAEDASRSDVPFLLKVVKTAVDSGATTVNIPDTVGYADPEEYGKLIKQVVDSVKGRNVDIAVHCHNDLGLATANSLAAIKAGATQIECTVNGIGERAGNTALEEVVMNLKTRRDVFDADTGIDTTKIMKTSKMLQRIIGIKVQPNKAIVGENAFAHESGIHQHGVLQNKSTYEIMTPESIGLTQNVIVLGKHSGKHALNDKLVTMGYTVTPERLQEIFEQFKNLCDRQKSVTDRDIEALVVQKPSIPERYTLERFVINVGNTITTTSAVTLKDKDGNEIEQVMASKFGPIDASYKAINAMVGEGEFELVDFLIDALTGGTDAQGTVTAKIKKDGKIYNGYGVDVDIVEAAIKAYISAINNMVYDQEIAAKQQEA